MTLNGHFALKSVLDSATNDLPFKALQLLVWCKEGYLSCETLLQQFPAVLPWGLSITWSTSEKQVEPKK